ncbi:MAG: YfbM family protein [Acidimicrobiales bacterium]|nr:YfbM family protein [Acidimicrobiales bacterium]
MGMVMFWKSVDATTGEALLEMDPEDFFDWLDSESAGVSFDLDKAWHAVHFTLTGTAWGTETAVGKAVLGGEEFAEDMGYGPPRWLSPAEVAETATALEGLSVDQFTGMLDFESMAVNDIYPNIWGGDSEADDLVDFVVTGFRQLRDRFIQVAAAGDGFVISLQ